ncbi:MAG: hypothetical protein JNM45_13045 [Rhizobiales bacterium]|nr:hypothetical protein [Hyphomicrobiales bacterium]
MHTQTHIIMGAALGGRSSRNAWAGAAGGLLPDIPMLLAVAGLKIMAVPDPIIFGIIYWQEWLQVANAVGHDFFLWGGLAVLALWRRERLAATAGDIDRWSMALVLALSGFLHTLVDFFCHREDAHMSFWPLSRWKFMSPVSYWDPAHYGHIISTAEALLGLVLAMLLFQRFPNHWTRILLAFAMLLYAAVPAYFILR